MTVAVTQSKRENADAPARIVIGSVARPSAAIESVPLAGETDSPLLAGSFMWNWARWV